MLPDLCIDISVELGDFYLYFSTLSQIGHTEARVIFVKSSNVHYMIEIV